MGAIRPQPGPQEAFLSTPADIAIYGGAAGGGKTFAMLMEPVRHIANPNFGAVIFRRNSKMVRAEGGLWDESSKLYPLLGAEPKESVLEWKFQSGARVSFQHLEHEKDKYSWQSAQIPLIGFDELTHFTKSQFFYLLSRNRSTCGVRPYVRATCNPDADSWVADFLSWWIDETTGLAIEDRAGAVRWLVRLNDTEYWADTADALREQFPGTEPKSVTFIPARLEDNQILMTADPGYLANLMAQDRVERERLLGGNWKIRKSAGEYFQRGWFEVVDSVPATAVRVRSWDLAATETKEGDDPDWTVGCRMSRADGIYYVEHVERFRASPHKVESAILNLAKADGRQCGIFVPQDPGQAGKAQAKHLIRMLAGFTVHSERETGDKVTRASPFSAQCEAGNVKIVRGKWNEAFLTELENFPGGHDDQVDAASGAFHRLAAPRYRTGTAKVGGL